MFVLLYVSVSFFGSPSPPTISPVDVTGLDESIIPGGRSLTDAGLVADQRQSFLASGSLRANLRSEACSCFVKMLKNGSEESLMSIHSCHFLFPDVISVKLVFDKAVSWLLCLDLNAEIFWHHHQNFGSVTPSKNDVFSRHSCERLYEHQVTSFAILMISLEWMVLMNPQPDSPVKSRSELFKLHLCSVLNHVTICSSGNLDSPDFTFSDLKVESLLRCTRLFSVLLPAKNSSYLQSNGGCSGNSPKPNFLLWAFDKFGPLAGLNCWIIGLVGPLGEWSFVGLAQVNLECFYHLIALVLFMTEILTSTKESPLVLCIKQRHLIRVGILPDQRHCSYFENFQTVSRRTLIGLRKAVLSWSISGECATSSFKHSAPIVGLNIRGVYHRLSMRFGALSIYFLFAIVSRLYFNCFSLWLEDTIKQTVVSVIG